VCADRRSCTSRSRRGRVTRDGEMSLAIPRWSGRRLWGRWLASGSPPMCIDARRPRPPRCRSVMAGLSEARFPRSRSRRFGDGGARKESRRPDLRRARARTRRCSRCAAVIGAGGWVAFNKPHTPGSARRRNTNEQQPQEDRRRRRQRDRRHRSDSHADWRGRRRRHSRRAFVPRYGVRCWLLPPTGADEVDCRLPAAVGTGHGLVDVAT
jgi:hypothetical protein